MGRNRLERPTVAVCGLGIAGISACKNLTEAGFDVTGFDASDAIGGLWHYSEGERTSCLYNTRALVRRRDSDVPLEPGEIQEYLESYARHFGLGPRLRLETRVSAVNRVGNKWHLQLTKLDGESEEQAFDRLVLCTGLNHSPKQIHFDGIEDFKGQVFNTHTYKRQGDLYKLHSLARVLIVGLGATATDIARGLVGIAKSISISHRNGCLMLPFGKANDFCFPPLRTQRDNVKRPVMEQAQMFHKAFVKMQDEAFSMKPEWGLENPPPMPYKLPIIGDGFYEHLVSGAVSLVPGLKRVYESHVELSDGSSLEVDVIIISVGYTKSYSLLGPWDPSRNMPQAWKDTPGSMGRPLPRLYQGIFSLDFPDSLAYLEHVGATLSATINGDLASMALAQVWAGNTKLPSDAEMARNADKQNQMAISLASKGEIYDPAMVDRPEWNLWVDKAAGLGIYDRIGNGWKSWRLMLTDYRLYKALLDGTFVPQVYRLFDEGKRKPWAGARESFLRANGMR
ncbi:FAD/NAD(P)-binding domain-containing protein [Trichoderma citrinoviride]|uniref:FAD/NAD(P)-binding domain-containing protein n=1 Tax=Trichoderma citrinoviride TaxID=58853 RepID=A0A2T4B1R9_9HYPO|nr:FAD/NAD(P)-binding domain-containing protein [Trichoderma citrinoviride]PTB63267.1 FAD/NAD(P)-binding domain-containing protein [Trichoderma citrinoviride]